MSKRALIVDEEPNISIFLESLIRRAACEVLTARDGEEGLAALAEWRPDLVLLDVMMPRKSGFDVCQAIRADASLAGLRVVMRTAKGRDSDVAKGLALGADASLTKLFSTQVLVQRVRELLGDAA